MFKDGEEAKVGYPTEGFDGDVAGRSFHNGRFVQRLRQAAAACASVTVRQGVARRLLKGGCMHPRCVHGACMPCSEKDAIVLTGARSH
jgi:squalene monooxygenase